MTRRPVCARPTPTWWSLVPWRRDPGLVDLVVADPGVGRHRILVGIRGGLRQRIEGLFWWDHASSRVRPGLVVVADEDVDLALELGDGGRRVLLAQPALQGLVEPLDLALGLGLTGQSELRPMH